MERSSGLNVGCIVVMALLAGIIGGLGGGYFMARAVTPVTSGGGPVIPVPQPSGAVSVVSENDAVVKAVRLADPSVVKVIAKEEAYLSMRDYLMGTPQLVEGLGSGVIFRFEEDGHQYVLTNSHVVRGAKQIIIKLVDGRQLEGELAGQDEEKDIAVVRLVNPPDDLPTSTLGDSSDIQIGERVLAIGHPFDFEHTVTVGYVSAVGNRQFGDPQASVWRNVIQTDAAINQGNSGGPLVNLAGAVVGINTLIYSPTGAGNIGLGFAIPINDAKEMLYYLVKGGPWIGIAAIPNSQGFAAYLGLAVSDGIVVKEITRGAPAAEAGVRQWDVILEVDGKGVSNNEELRSALISHRIGDEISLKLARDNQTLDTTVTAGSMSGG